MDASRISLRKASIEDAVLIHAMQVEAFAPLLARYHDADMSPGAEKVERVVARL